MSTNTSSFEKYISTLPPKLSGKEQQELLTKYYTTHDKTIRDKLVSHNLRLAAYIVFKHFGNTKIDKEDLMQYATIGLVNAVDNFNPNQNYSFSTYANTSMKNTIFLALEQTEQKLNTVSLDNNPAPPEIHQRKSSFVELVVDETESHIAEDFIAETLFEKVYNFVKENLSEREIYIFEASAGINHPKPKLLKEIAKDLNLSHQRVAQIRKTMNIRIYNAFKRDFASLKKVPVKKNYKKPKSKNIAPEQQTE